MALVSVWREIWQSLTASFCLLAVDFHELQVYKSSFSVLQEDSISLGNFYDDSDTLSLGAFSMKDPLD